MRNKANDNGQAELEKRLWAGLCFHGPFVSHATQTSQGTKMPRANWAVLTKYQLPVPSAPLLSVFSDSVNDGVGLIESLVFKNRNLRRTRDLLLPKLITGALDVSKLDIQSS